MTTCKCDNCQWEGSDTALRASLEDTPDLGVRLAPGSEVPAGECPKCGCFAYLVPTTYTVLLARPDSIANDSLDTYMTSADGDSVEDAVAAARAEACEADDWDPEDAEDYAVLMVVAGARADLNPER